MKEVIGTVTMPQIVFSLVGVSIMLLIDSNKRFPPSQDTPYEWRVWFLILDNWKRITLNLLLIFVTLRFFPEIFGIQLTGLWCLSIGMSFDKLAEIIKSKTSFLDVNRDKLMVVEDKQVKKEEAKIEEKEQRKETKVIQEQ